MLRKVAAAVAVCAGIAVLGALLIAAGDQDPGATPTPSQVAGRTMSPFCPGLSLEECPSQQAGELRAEIERRIAAGATNRQIDRWLVAEYGESVLARPPQAVAWIIPAAFVLAGLAAVAYLLGRRPAAVNVDEAGLVRTAQTEHSATPAESAYRERMLEDLSIFSKGTE